jgi:hypothetical protein
MSKDETDAYGYPNGRETTTNPVMFSHDTHGDTSKKAKTYGKTEYRQKQKCCDDEEEYLKPFFGFGFKESPCFFMLSYKIDDEDD